MPNKYLDSVQLARLVTKIKSLVSTTVAGYLPLSGGSINGNLSVSGTMTGNIVTDSPLKPPTDDTVLGVYGGTDYNKGAALQMFGKDNATYPGWFSIRASDGSNNKIFIGKPDGTLTWAGKNVITSAGGEITGAIRRDGTISAAVNDNSFTQYNGASSADNGAYIALYGKNHATLGGRITLRAQDGSNNTALALQPNGTMTWGGSNVVTNTTVHNLLVVETKTSSSATIAQNGTNAFTIGVSKSGYTPIGVVGYNVGGSGRSRANVFNCSLSSTTVTMEVWNQSTGSVTWTASADVLYVKNSI